MCCPRQNRHPCFLYNYPMRPLKTFVIMAFLLPVMILAGCGKAVRNTTQTITATATISDPKYKQMTGKVVVFGTSIWAIDPGPTGIAARLREMTSFEVTDNTVMGGTATRVEDDPLVEGSLISILLYNDDKYSKRMREDVKEPDYVILAFGGNDFSRGVPPTGEGNSFENAMRLGISTVREMNPDANIILIPSLGGWALIDGEYVSPFELDFGGGTLGEYIRIVEEIAQEEDLLCVNMNEVIVFSEDDPLKYFEDGSHLTEYGRMVYTQYLTEQIYDHYYS